MLETIQRPELLSETVPLDNIPDPEAGTAAQQLAEQRNLTGRSIDAMPWLPQLPDDWARELYEQIEELERTLIAPTRQGSEYYRGTALRDNDVLIIGHSLDGILFTAEHATATVREESGELGAWDLGTGGLAALLAQNHGIGLIANGRQTGNAALDFEHPVKTAMDGYLARACGFVSVHGMSGGKFVRRNDTSEVQISIGLGENPPSSKAAALAEEMTRIAYDLGLYAIIGNRQQYYSQHPGSTSLQRESDGSAYRHELGAFRPTTTVNYVRMKDDQQGGMPPAIQIELASFLRLPSINRPHGRDKRSEIMGVALGYLFTEQVAALMKKEATATDADTTTFTAS